VVGTAVKVETAVTEGETETVGSWGFGDGLHANVVTSSRMIKDPGRNFISPLYPAHYYKREEEMCGVYPHIPIREKEKCAGWTQ
jgi:hypothetical protein